MTSAEPTGLEVAVVGLACRFPGAPDADRFWRNLRDGVESITVAPRERLVAGGVSPALLANPDFVPAQGVLADADLFDADFFGVNPREAALMDPQHRVLLECAWAALEDAALDPRHAPGPVGVWAGSYYNTYLDNLAGHIDPDDTAGVFARNIANESDYLATRIAYRLGLSGPAMTVQSACSTSLVAVHTACQALIAGECDTALAGGVTVRAQQLGYVHQPGGIFSADGHCRPFDATAQGTVAGNGAGVVVLRRLADALADGDPIRAVIRGSAVGNDGAQRVGFTAPGVAGQERVIRAALAAAEVAPATVSYVEAHGSGTPVGDPIEVEALSRAFRGVPAGRIALGAVKSNIGHTHAASGVAGLIKTVLALQHRQLPPSLHFDTANPDIDFDTVPFRVNTALRDWPEEGGPRRAGVSSFGMGGTGAHVVLEEAPQRRAAAAGRQLLPVSARTAGAADAAVARLADHLDQSPDLPLVAVAATLQDGRHPFAHRRFVVADSTGAAVDALRDPRVVRSGTADGTRPPVAMLFPGLGEQRPGMARELYDAEPVFRAEVDRCAEILEPLLGVDPRTLLYPAGESASDSGGIDLRAMLGRGPRRASGLDATRFAQPITFVVEYALARLWESWGVRADALLGYSIGEYVAACLSGVLSLPDALLLVAKRAELIEGLPAGAMLAVPLPEARVRELLGDGLSLAAVNGPLLCVVAGDEDAVSGLERRLTAEEVAVRRVRTTHAFHSHAMAPIAGEFTALLAEVTLAEPRVPCVSTLTGDWVTPAQALDRDAWVRHMREPVRFADAVSRLWAGAEHLLLEVGPGQTLSSLALLARPRGAAPGLRAVSSLPGEYDARSEQAFLLTTAGRLWAEGVDLDWAALRGGGDTPRTTLPTYPFEGKRYWIDPAPARAGRSAPSLDRKDDIAEWFNVPVWEPLAPHATVPSGEPRSWLLFVDEHGVGTALADTLIAAGHTVTTARAGADWREVGPAAYEVDPTDPAHHRALLAAAGTPDRVVHLWNVGPPTDLDALDAFLDRGFVSLLLFNAAAAGGPLDLTVVTTGAHAVLGTERLAPEQAVAAGPCLVLPLEQLDTTCRSVDLDPAAAPEAAAERLLSELLNPGVETVTAVRGGRRWRRGHRSVRVPGSTPPLRHGGVYLITGGFGGVGLELSRALAADHAARLVLVGRTADPGHPAVRELTELGAEVVVAAGDVADADRMAEIADEAVARFGAVHGIVHAAGVPAAGLAQLKDPAEALRVLAPKVRGGLVVDALSRRLRPDFTVHCSSTLAITGGVGQVDYVAANAVLGAIAARAAADGDPRVVAVDWDGWQSVGMAARMIGGGREGPVAHPLLDACLVDRPGLAVYSARLSVAGSWLIDEHRMVGHAVVPGTGHLELVRAAYEHHSGGTGVGIALREVTFLSPVVVGDDDGRDLRVVLEPAGAGRRFHVVSRAVGADTEDWHVHVTGAVERAPDGAPGTRDLAALVEGLRDSGPVTHTGPMGFGPRSDCLRRVHLGPRTAVAELELPAAFAGDLDLIRLHPSLLDLAAGFHGMNFAEEFRIPLSYGRLTLFAPLPARMVSHHRFREADRPGKQTLVSDITLLDEHGAVVATVEGFVLKKVDDLADRLTALRDGTSAEVAGYRFPRGEADNALRAHLREGIRPAEGVEALRRVLGADLGPNVAVVAKDLDAVIADIAGQRPGAAAPQAAAHPRPTAAGDYTEPADDLERVLAAQWAELLGLDRVGVVDDFFELGGHSLLGLQVVAGVRRHFGVDLALTALFEALTVRGLADALRPRLSPQPTAVGS
ncbi:type I polyketide synthase [Actinokineospora pegani]|uniref:type I polyketide synthase n=1 Tax=Actinokineospora pegani TaxID=2654637 RepID=UPI0018D48C5B|nr:type I polyketide synthase [Actinokineospora pegani]